MAETTLPLGQPDPHHIELCKIVGCVAYALRRSRKAKGLTGPRKEVILRSLVAAIQLMEEIAQAKYPVQPTMLRNGGLAMLRRVAERPVRPTSPSACPTSSTTKPDVDAQCPKTPPVPPMLATAPSIRTSSVSDAAARRATFYNLLVDTDPSNFYGPEPGALPSWPWQGAASSTDYCDQSGACFKAIIEWQPSDCKEFVSDVAASTCDVPCRTACPTRPASRAPSPLLVVEPPSPTAALQTTVRDDAHRMPALTGIDVAAQVADPMAMPPQLRHLRSSMPTPVRSTTMVPVLPSVQLPMPASTGTDQTAAASVLPPSPEYVKPSAVRTEPPRPKLHVEEISHIIVPTILPMREVTNDSDIPLYRTDPCPYDLDLFDDIYASAHPKLKAAVCFAADLFPEYVDAYQVSQIPHSWSRLARHCTALPAFQAWRATARMHTSTARSKGKGKGRGWTKARGGKGQNHSRPIGA